MKTKAAQLLELARHEAAKATTWADLSNFFFDPEDGLISKAYAVGPERTAFMKSPEYKAIRQLIEEMQQRMGFIEGMTPKKSGKFVVRLPRSLHAALEAEAEREGVSLNQLVVAKLAMQMSHLVSAPGST
jgi:hypothetical protein